MQKRLEVTLMDKQTGPNDFLVVLPGEIIEIPQDSDKSWLTLFYSLPRELAEKWKPAYELPRCPYSEERRRAASKQAKQNGVHKKVIDLFRDVR